MLSPGTAACAAAGTASSASRQSADSSRRRAMPLITTNRGPRLSDRRALVGWTTTAAAPGVAPRILAAHGRHDLLRPRRAVAGHRRRRRPARGRAGAPSTNDPAGTTAYGTSVGYVPLREWIAEQARRRRVEQVLVTNGSMQADAFLFETLVEPGDAVVVEKPTYDRTLLNLRGRGADVRMVSLETDGIDIDALERCCATAACGRSSRTSSRTSRTRPATRCRRQARRAAARSPPSTTS